MLSILRVGVTLAGVIGIIFVLISDDSPRQKFLTAVFSIIIPIAAWVLPTLFSGGTMTIIQTPSPSPIPTIEPTITPTIYGTSFINAKSVNIDNEHEARFEFEEDDKVDHWYYFDIKEDTFLSLSLSGEPNMSLGVYLYNNNGEDVLVSEYGKDQVVNLNYPLQTGKFYLKITSDIPGLYKINPMKTNSSYTNEEPQSGNDTYQNAIVLSANGNQNGHLGYYSDTGNVDEADWYKLSVDVPSIVELSLRADNPLDVKLTLIGNDGSERIDYDSGLNKQIIVKQALQKGLYYIKVSKINNYGGYNLSTKTIIPQYASDIEPNDSFQYATQLNNGVEACGQIGFNNDTNRHDNEDWYIIQLNSTTANISLIPIDATGSIRVTLIDSTASNSLTSAYGNENIITCQREKLEMGTYYIKVSANGNTYGCYSLKVN